MGILPKPAFYVDCTTAMVNTFTTRDERGFFALWGCISMTTVLYDLTGGLHGNSCMGYQASSNQSGITLGHCAPFLFKNQSVVMKAFKGKAMIVKMYPNM